MIFLAGFNLGDGSLWARQEWLGGVNGLTSKAWPELENSSGSRPWPRAVTGTSVGLGRRGELTGQWEGNDEGCVLEPSLTSTWNLRSSLTQPPCH